MHRRRGEGARREGDEQEETRVQNVGQIWPELAALRRPLCIVAR